MSDLMTILDKLGDLYGITGYDWDFRLHHCLTEPTCPTAVISPEGWRISRYRVDCDDLEESTRHAVDLVYREIVERTVIGSCAPLSNPDDDAFAKWLHARAAGSDDKMPDVPGRGLPDTYQWVVEGFVRENAAGLKRGLITEGERYLVAYVAATIAYYFPKDRIDDDKAKDVVRAALDACGSGAESRSAQPNQPNNDVTDPG